MAKDKTQLKTSVEAEVITDGSQQNLLQLDILLQGLETKIAARKTEMDALAEQQQQVIETGESIGGSGGAEGEGGTGIGARVAGEEGSLRRTVGGFMAKTAVLKHFTGLGTVGVAGALALPAVVVAAPKVEEAAYGIGNSMSRFTGQDGVQKFNPWYVGKATVGWAGDKATDIGKGFVGGSQALLSRLGTLGPLGDAQGYDTLEEKQQRAESIKRQAVDFIFGRDPEMIQQWDRKVAEGVLKANQRLQLSQSAIVGELAGLSLPGGLTEMLARQLDAGNTRRRQRDIAEIEHRKRLKNEAAYESGEEMEAD